MEDKAINSVLTPSGDSILCIAIKSGCLDVAFQLAQHKIGLNVPDKNGDFPLHLAVAKNQLELMGMLLDNGACVNVRDKLRNTPLHMACLKARPQLVKVLLEKDLTGRHYDYLEDVESSLLRLAVQSKCLTSVELLLKAGTNPVSVDTFRNTDLLRALASGPDGEDIALLMVQYSEPLCLQKPLDNGVTHLSWAVHMGCCSLVKALLEKMSELSVMNFKPDYHPVLIAIRNNCWTCFNNLIAFRGEAQLEERPTDMSLHLPSALEFALNSASWKINLNSQTESCLFKKYMSSLSVERLKFVDVLIRKYGVDVTGPFFNAALADSVHLRTCINAAKQALSLCISAFGGNNLHSSNSISKANLKKLETLFETLAKSKEYELMMKLYDAGFCPNTGNILSVHHHHERTGLPMDVVDELNEMIRRPRTLKNLAVVNTRGCIHRNVIYNSQFLSIPLHAQWLVTLGE